jgi:hypothetical protein
MAQQKRSDLVYRKMVFVLVMALLCNGSLFAHGNEKHVMGTVKAVGADSVTVETAAHHDQTVQITAQTKFIKSGAPSSLSDLKVGDRVVIHAKAAGDRLQATEVKFGAATNSAVKK